MFLSEELNDEVEAINSIYGPGCLVESSNDPTVFILRLPEETASLRLQFSSAYPDEPPAVLGTYSAGEHGKRGEAARDLDLFRRAVAEVYEPGQVCLFDAVEKLKELLAEDSDPDTAHEELESAPDTESNPRTTVATTPSSLPSPPWTLSVPITELKSTFLARVCPVTSPSQATTYLQHLLSTDKKVRLATHNITAWRIRGPNGTSFQDCDDDGETAAGGRLLHLMQLMDVWDAMVVVTRWYGGQKLGPRRFAVINAVARDAFVRTGLVSEGPPGGKKKGHGKP